MRTQVAIVGAGPAGLVLSHLLHRGGIESVVLERHSREYVPQRVRAGVLEQGTVDLLRAMGVAERLEQVGVPHEGIELRFDGASHRIPLTELTGRSIWIYGQQHVVEDLIDARLAAGGEIHFDVSDVTVGGVETDSPVLRFTDPHGRPQELLADVVAGCDGFHGVCRTAIPRGVLRTYEREYPFGWLGILAKVPPSTEELIYAHHQRGFALHSLRSPELSRLYIQVDPTDAIVNWPDDRIWSEMHRRFAVAGWELNEGPIIDRGIRLMRSFVVEPMQYHRLFLAGDAAHIVPPTGAKGLNLAVADVAVLGQGLLAWYRDGRTDLLNAYSATCLRRVWRVQQFSWWMTGLVHTNWSSDGFDERLQKAELRYVTSSHAAATGLAENYVGLPIPVTL